MNGYELKSIATRFEGSPVEGTGEACADGETGLLVPPGDPAALADAIVALLADAPRRAAMAKASRERHARLFTLERMLDETAAIHDELGRP